MHIEPSLGSNSQSITVTPYPDPTTPVCQISIRPNISLTVRSHSQVTHLRINMLHRWSGTTQTKQFMLAIRQRQIMMTTSLLSENVIIAVQKSCSQVSAGSAVLILKCLLTIYRVSGCDRPSTVLCSWQGELYLICAPEFSLRWKQVFKMLYITTRGSDAPPRKPDGSVFDCGSYGHAKIQRFVVIMAFPKRQYSRCMSVARRSSS